ncbi:MAG: hypothetical protein CVT85_01785 [Alphaproteobacteria bacterium HGW-Alphaproteobacteria-7]|jgi:ABC-type multidrug transport system fused ATPase/permease subunit|nr:MAG: hypothetical protein CVT85_01785 [Alphaproteobacteria bacterium HGW-Alphaproteobacteria-7]
MTIHQSPLMSGTRLFLNTLLFMLYVVTVIIAVAAAAIVALILAQGQASGFTTGDTMFMLTMLVFLFLAITFFGLLRAIVHSVSQGDPFNRANPERLTRLGWLALVLWMIDLGDIFWQAGAFTGPAATPDLSTLAADAINQAFGLVGPVTLFILANVFRHGATMRADLEGTV